MEERHENEQYFFDEATLAALGGYLARWQRPCCLCTPLLGKWLVDRGHDVAILDIDERFADLPGFVRFDVLRPRWIGESFDVIVCDPPFYDASLRQLFAAVRTLAGNDFSQPLLLSYLTRRLPAVQRTFERFGLRQTGYSPAYRTVEDCEKNAIEFLGNLSEDQLVGFPRNAASH